MSVRAQDEEAVSLVSLRAGGRLFGLATGAIREVLRQGRLMRVPLAPALVAGVIVYRGEVLTVLSLRALLGMAAPADASCVLVMDGGEAEERFGLLVDGVGGVVMVEQDKRSGNPATLDVASRALFAGAFRTEDGLLVELDAERLRPSRVAGTGLFGGR